MQIYIKKSQIYKNDTLSMKQLIIDFILVKPFT